ncbi:phospholipid:diacylglycerol acyltransferase [Diutina catenulata]
MAVTNRKKAAKDTAAVDATVEEPVDTAASDTELSDTAASSPSGRKRKRHHHHRSSEKVKLKKKLHESRRVVFALGAFLGLMVTVFFSTISHPTLKSELDRLVTFENVNDIFDDWKDMLPSGLVNMFTDFDFGTSNQTLHGSAESFSVGKRMVAEYNLTDKHNVVMVPGVISTGLESWGTSSTGECPSINHFRKRMWGSFYMLRTMVLDKACWLKHVMLDPESGLDPPNIRVRAAQGFEAADFFVAGYWIWNKILQNLSVIGYSPNTMLSASYDWRLAYMDLERRDHYFSKLKSTIELVKQEEGRKSVLVGHSMGTQVIYYFMKWVEAEGPHYGNGGPSWCNDYLAAVVDISGSSLGTPKSITALLSGEMKDTVQLNAVAVYGLEKFFSRKERVNMLRTFGGVASMFPKGGSLIWGDLQSAPDDPQTNHTLIDEVDAENNHRPHGSFGQFIRYHDDERSANYTVDETIDKLLEQAPEWYRNRVLENYSWGVAKTEEEFKHNDHHHKYWSNPLEARLPNAPDMKIYCFYGVGNPTERAYTYTKAANYTGLEMLIDTDSENAVMMSDGDGTVSLLTHSLCHEWKRGKASRYNPAGIPVTIVEIKHEPDRFDIRGGAKTAEHVDILGSAELNEMVLKVAAGEGDKIEDRYVSDLKDMVAKMDF